METGTMKIEDALMGVAEFIRKDIKKEYCIDTVEHAADLFAKFRAELDTYRATGYTPEQINVALPFMCGLTIERIVELARAEEQGRLITFPCAVGSTIYEIRNKEHALGVGISPRHTESITINEDGNYFYSHQGIGRAWRLDIGKTVFLIREEAEAALHEGLGE